MNRREAAEVLEELKKPGRFTILDTGGAYEALQMAIDALGADTNVGSKGDMIYRQDAIEAVKHAWAKGLEPSQYIEILPSAQPAPCEDCVSRKSVIRLLHSGYHSRSMIEEVEELPSAHQTLYGYDIEHLKLIANVLQKENLPPERVAEALMDIGRIVAIVTDEFEETLRKSVEQCMDFAVGEERRNDE